MITCIKCKERLSEDLFSFKDKAKGRRSSVCKKCHADYVRNWYKDNPISQRTATKELKARKKQYIRDLKSQPCMDCKGIFHFAAMDFDHRPETIKSFNPSSGWEYGWPQLKAEIDKCDLVCANCHRVRTFERLSEAGDETI